MKESNRPKTTINLGTILKGGSKEEKKSNTKNGTHPVKEDLPINENQLRTAWTNFAESKKHHMVEYHLLTQPFTFKNNIISLALTNAIEEPILVSIKLELLTYLREMLGNSSLQLEGILAEPDNSKRIAYTNKEKFEHLMDKNPLLKDLKDKFGLDPDF